MEGEIKTARIEQKSTFFFYFFGFFLEIQDIRKSKTPIFERGSHKMFLGQALPIFQTSPSGVIKGMRKCGDFKTSLSNFRVKRSLQLLHRRYRITGWGEKKGCFKY